MRASGRMKSNEVALGMRVLCVRKVIITTTTG